MTDSSAPFRLVMISGVSGSGKSIALRSLEDAGYNCIDNLPLALLDQTVHLLTDLATVRYADRAEFGLEIDLRVVRMIVRVAALAGRRSCGSRGGGATQLQLGIGLAHRELKTEEVVVLGVAHRRAVRAAPPRWACLGRAPTP